jgi:hypothetical protein
MVKCDFVKVATKNLAPAGGLGKEGNVYEKERDVLRPSPF